MLEASILNTIKKLIGVDPEYDVFDQDILVHINSALSTLTQIGAGPANGLFVEDETAKWSDFFTEAGLNPIKSYVYLRVRMMFDPPSSSFVLTSYKEQIKELEWRINVEADDSWYVGPPIVVENQIDGGFTIWVPDEEV